MELLETAGGRRSEKCRNAPPNVTVKIGIQHKDVFLKFPLDGSTNLIIMTPVSTLCLMNSCSWELILYTLNQF